jgi:hypothetical protein
MEDSRNNIFLKIAPVAPDRCLAAINAKIFAKKALA